METGGNERALMSGSQFCIGHVLLTLTVSPSVRLRHLNSQARPVNALEYTTSVSLTSMWLHIHQHAHNWGPLFFNYLTILRFNALEEKKECQEWRCGIMDAEGCEGSGQSILEIRESTPAEGYLKHACTAGLHGCSRCSAVLLSRYSVSGPTTCLPNYLHLCFRRTATLLYPTPIPLSTALTGNQTARTPESSDLKVLQLV
ncbi:hypothetical protein BT96DRAFT_991199 [Gymnopus androsaceus JB14]|uniref:Uncharacterized protein n=1 Tax=Gymnopus androsaceus JB14 TaxID=1447944 RepID=A0A6A4HW04_9AGAR|nr:hypothetical protein BT96DRAFT_991199 [Gymnopus androsaceus JB14]